MLSSYHNLLTTAKRAKRSRKDIGTGVAGFLENPVRMLV
jgi:hypothetical protein